MAAVFPLDYGKRDADETLASWRNALVFCLFKNDLTPDEDTVFADVTPADFSGYAEVTPSWAGPVVDSDGRVTHTATAQVVFTHNGGGTGNTVYGYYVRINEHLEFIERFSAPRSMAVAGDEIRILPTMLVGNLAPP